MAYYVVLFLFTSQCLVLYPSDATDFIGLLVSLFEIWDQVLYNMVHLVPQSCYVCLFH